MNICHAKQSLPAPELLTTVSQPGLEVFQLTTDPDVCATLFYNYQQALSPDSRLLFISREHREMHELTLVDLENNFEMSPIVSWQKGHGASNTDYKTAAFSLDGTYIYYTLSEETRLVIARYQVATGRTEEMFGIDRVASEFGGRRIIRPHWLSFSHDAKRLLCVVMIEGTDKYYTPAMFTYNMETMTRNTAFLTGPRNWNNKSQYAPCPGPDGEYLISVSDGYSMAYFDAAGRWQCDQMDDAKLGGSFYLVTETGEVAYTYPVGRDYPRQNVSHHQWFGQSLAQVFHCDAFDMADHFRGCILLTDPVPADEHTRHLGRRHPRANQLDMTRHITRPDVYHMCVSADAKTMVCDTSALGYPQHPEDLRSATRYLYGCTVRKDADGPYVEPKFILTAHSSWTPYGAECVPCMTPDKKWIFFASDYPEVNGYGGAWHTPQVFAVRNFEFPE